MNRDQSCSRRWTRRVPGLAVVVPRARVMLELPSELANEVVAEGDKAEGDVGRF